MDPLTPQGTPDQSGIAPQSQAMAPQPPEVPPAPAMQPLGNAWAPGVAPIQVGTRGRRFRWAVSSAVVLVVVVAAAAGAFVLSGSAGANQSLTAGYAPQDTIAFVDMRADLPGDQHQNLADFLSHFPGFKDRAQFDNAFDEILNKVTGAVSPDLTYQWAFKSWTTGEVSIAVTSLGSFGNVEPLFVDFSTCPFNGTPCPIATAAPPLSMQAAPNAVVIVAIKDRAAGEKWMSSEVGKTGITFAAQTYGGTQLYSGTKDGTSAAYAFTNKVLVLGTETAVKSALDAPAKGSLDQTSSYKTAMGTFSGDSLATFYLNPPKFLSSYTSAMSGVPGMNIDMSSLLGSMPAWMAGSIRAESGQVMFEMNMPATGKTSGSNTESVVASDLPASTVGVLEIHSVGSSIEKSIETLNADPSLAPSVSQIKQALNLIGGLSWIGDADVAFTQTASGFSGGLVVKTPDASTASSKKAMLTNLIALAGSTYGMTESDQTYHGTTITDVTVSSGGTKFQFGVAVKDDLVVAGLDDFVKSVLDTTSGNSLASQSDFQALMAAVGKSNVEYGYLNVPLLASAMTKLADASQLADYNLNYKPYIDHLGGAAFAVTTGDVVTMKLVITAR